MVAGKAKHVTDKNNNRATIAKWRSKAAAADSLKTLKDCSNCLDCKDCLNCERCTGCQFCIDCTRCRRCRRCGGCMLCVSCYSCSGCVSCRVCSNCRACWDCLNCHHCDTSMTSTSCDYCHGCFKVAGLVRKKRQSVTGPAGVVTIPRAKAVPKLLWALKAIAEVTGTIGSRCDARDRAWWTVRLAGRSGELLASKTCDTFAALQIFWASGYEIGADRFCLSAAETVQDIKDMARRNR